MTKRPRKKLRSSPTLRCSSLPMRSNSLNTPRCHCLRILSHTSTLKKKESIKECANQNNRLKPAYPGCALSGVLWGFVFSLSVGTWKSLSTATFSALLSFKLRRFAPPPPSYALSSFFLPVCSISHHWSSPRNIFTLDGCLGVLETVGIGQ